MAPVTSSAINKSKTVAPKAIARRRPAPAPAPAAAKPKSAPPVVAEDKSPSEQDATEGAAQVGVEHPETITVAAAAAVSSPIAIPRIGQSVQPTHSAQSQSVGNAEDHVPLPTPPATQEPAHGIPAQPRTQPTTVEQQTSSGASASDTHDQPSIPDDVPTARSDPITHETAERPLPVTAQLEHDRLGDIPSTTLDAVARAEDDASGQRAVPRVPSPSPVAGAKRKRSSPAPAVSQSHTGAGQAQGTEHASAQDNASQNAGVETSASVQESVEEPSAAAAPVAQMISPERARKPGLRSAPRPKAPINLSKPPRAPRAKPQKSTNTQGNAPAEDVATDIAVAAETQQEPPDGGVSPPAGPARKKPRAKRQPKSAARIVEDEDGNAIDEPDPAVEEGAEQPAKKQRRPRKPKEATEPAEAKEPKKPRKKRDPREIAAEDEEIEDPETYVIDPNNVRMSDLTRDRGVGRQSQRETKMAGIDWEGVARKRLEAAEAIQAGAKQTNGDGADQGTPRQAPSGPVLRVDGAGNLVVEQDSIQIDRQAKAAADAANMMINEDDDLTTRVNQMSWISDRRKDPTERLPFFKMKSDPWSDEETDRFYEALKMFGTDFFIISKMFPPKTRRQIKLKFIREERLDVDRVNRALSGESTVPMSIDHFAEATGQDVEHFKDPKLLEEELRLSGEGQREAIAKKKKDNEEAKQQRDIQMAARERENADRAQIRRHKQLSRAARRGGLQGSGTF